MTYPEAKALLAQHGQTQLLRFYDSLSDEEQANLLHQIEDLSLDTWKNCKQTATQSRGKLEPLGALTLPEIQQNTATYRKIGLDAIRAGKLGCVLLAGGQGSRLGFSHAKGMFNIGKTHDVYIFQCLIENLIAVTREADADIPLLIMTSAENHDDTQSFLEAHDFFGYPKGNVTFFTQEMVPAVDENGKILLKAPGEIALSPNGNGGWFSSIQHAGLLDMIHDSGMEWLNVFAVDNVLQRMADPVFLGATIASGCCCGGKVVSKATPDERVGVLCLEDGKPSIVEYYEMTEEMRTLRQPDGTLSYRFGVILNYLFRVDALMQTLGADFPLHAAHKKVPYVAEDGTTIQPETPNAYKFETLVLDMVHMQESCLAFEVERAREFAPIKNATGVDSVETAQALLEQNGVTL